MVAVMIASVLVSLSVLTQAAAPQDPPRPAPVVERPGSDITRSLNSGPPTGVLGTVPAASPAQTAPAARAPVQDAPVSRTPPVAAPVPAVTAPAAPKAAEPERPRVDGPQALTASAIAALPFRLEVPRGFTVTAQRPAPGVGIYAVRRGERTFAMIYTGPASQFPIYSGEARNAGGRSSIVVANGARRTAMEHLFQRQTAPAEIHVWLSSLDGDDLALAERIGNSVEPK